jgi:hypothetical protein
VALFSGAFRNTPETLLEGRLTSMGRMEYQFVAFGGITILFIEVKLHIGTVAERLNSYAQVIAECDGTSGVPRLNTVLTFCRLRMGELPERIPDTNHSHIVRWRRFHFLQLRGPAADT